MASPSPARTACRTRSTWPTATSGPPLMSAAPTAPAAASIHFAEARMPLTESSGDGSAAGPSRRQQRHVRRPQVSPSGISHLRVRPEHSDVLERHPLRPVPCVQVAGFIDPGFVQLWIPRRLRVCHARKMPPHTRTRLTPMPVEKKGGFYGETGSPDDPAILLPHSFPSSKEQREPL
jgi:hypothetical protein